MSKKNRSFAAKLSVFALFLSVVVSGPVSASGRFTEFGSDWVQVSNDYSIAVATSNDGAIVFNLIGSNIYRSNDYGVTWVDVTNQYVSSGTFDSNGSYQWVAVSGDGQVVVISEFRGYIWVSRDSGASWIKSTDPLGTGTPLWSGASMGWYFWGKVSVSDSGQRIALTGHDGYVYISNDYGNTFSKRSLTGGSGLFEDLSMSDDGRVIIVGSHILDPSSGFFISQNYGASFSKVTNLSVTTATVVAVSGDGNHLLVSSYNNEGIWTSSNGAASWSQSTFKSGTSDQAWSAAISKDGSRIIIARWGLPPLTSDDFGATFSEGSNFAPVSATWYTAVSSSDGSRIYIGGDAGLYRSTPTFADYGTVTLLLTECMSDTSTATSVRAASVILVSDTASAASQGDGSTYKYYSETDTALWGADYTYGSTQNPTTCGYRDMNGTVILSRGRFIASVNAGVLSETNTNTTDFLQYIGNTETASAYSGIACGNMGAPHAASVTTSCTTAIQANYKLLTYATPVQVRTSNVKTGLLGQPSGKIYTFVKVLKSVIAAAPAGTSWVATETFTVTSS